MLVRASLAARLNRPARNRTATVGKRIRSTNLYHSRQCGVDRTDCTVVCFVTLSSSFSSQVQLLYKVLTCKIHSQVFDQTDKIDRPSNITFFVASAEVTDKIIR